MRRIIFSQLLATENTEITEPKLFLCALCDLCGLVVLMCLLSSSAPRGFQ